MLCDLQIFSGSVYHLEQPHTQSPFLFPIVFGINLIPFLMANMTVQLYIRLLVFSSSITCRATKGDNFFATEGVNTSPILAPQWWPFESCRTKSATFGQGKVWTHRQFQSNNGDITSVFLSLPLSLSLSFSLSLSLSPSAPSAPSAQYTKRFHAWYYLLEMGPGTRVPVLPVNLLGTRVRDRKKITRQGKKEMISVRSEINRKRVDAAINQGRDPAQHWSIETSNHDPPGRDRLLRPRWEETKAQPLMRVWVRKRTEFLKTLGNSRRHEIHSCSAKSFKSPKLWMSTKWEGLLTCTRNDLSSGETLCTSVQSQLQSVLARLKTRKKPEQSRKWATWAALHFWEADDDKLWASPCGRRSSLKLYRSSSGGAWRWWDESLPLSLFRADYYSCHEHGQWQLRSTSGHDNLNGKAKYVVGIAVRRNDGRDSGGSGGATVSVWCTDENCADYSSDPKRTPSSGATCLTKRTVPVAHVYSIEVQGHACIGEKKKQFK